MELVSVCPLQATLFEWQPRPGVFAFTVVCKATFSLAPAMSPLADVQEAINDDDNYWDDDPARSVYCPSDRVPFKPSPEVVLVGHAFAPPGKSVRQLFARMVVGNVDKSIEVVADESFTQEGTRREGPRFTKMPLRYERAAGGPDTTNPVGVRRDVVTTLGVTPLPNLRLPGTHLASRGDFVAAAGFGPIAPDWPTRRERIARLGRPFAFSDPDEPLPDGLDPAFFLSAPRDQVLTSLRADERIVLEHLHPEHERVATNLAGIEPRVFVDTPRHAPWELKLACDTLWIDTDRSLCTLTWRGHAQLEARSERGRAIVAMEKVGQPLAWRAIEALLEPRAAHPPDDPPTRPDGAESEITGDIGPSHVPSWLIPGAGASDARPSLRTPTDPRAPRSAAPTTPASRDLEEGTIPLSAVLEELGAQAPPWLFPARPAASPAGPAIGSPGQGPGLIRNPGQGPGLTNSPPREPPQVVVSPVTTPATVTPAPVADQQSEPRPWLDPPRPVTTSRWSGLAPSFLSAAKAPETALPATSTARATFAPAPAEPLSNPAPTAASVEKKTSWLASTRGAAPGEAKPSVPPERPSAATISSSQIPGSGAGLAQSHALAPTAPREDAPTRGALAASNAAALAAAPAAPKPVADPMAKPPPPTQTAKAHEHVHLVWYDPSAVPRVRALDTSPARTAVSWMKGDGGARGDAGDAAERSGVLRALSSGAWLDEAGLNVAAGAAYRDDGSFEPPVVLVAGELCITFDEVEALRAAITVAMPFLAADKRLRDTVTNANEVLKPELPADAAEGLTARIEDAFANGSRAVAPGYFQTNTERLLLEGRRYQRKTVLGEKRIRVTFTPAGGQASIPAYIAESAAAKLPVFRRFRARVAAELVPQEDQYESHRDALVVLALGRVLPARRT